MEPFLCSPTNRAAFSRCSTGTAPASGCYATATPHNARFGLSSKIFYQFHPLFGKDYETFGSAGGERDMVYVRLADRSTRGVPAWMFDPAVCSTVRVAETPLIGCGALADLAALLARHQEIVRNGGHEVPQTKPSNRSARDA